MAIPVDVSIEEDQIAQGAILTLRTVFVNPGDLKDGLYEFTWTIEGPAARGAAGSGRVGTLTPARGRYEFSEYHLVVFPDPAGDLAPILTDWDTSDHRPGEYTATLVADLLDPSADPARDLLAEMSDDELSARGTSRSALADAFGDFVVPPVEGDGEGGGGRVEFVVVPRPFASGDRVQVTMDRAAIRPTSADAHWPKIRAATKAMNWDAYARFMDVIVCGDTASTETDPPALRPDRRADTRTKVTASHTPLPFPEVDPYRVLKAATEVFMTVNCGVTEEIFEGLDLVEESGRLGRALRPGDLEQMWRRYLVPESDGQGGTMELLPYLALIRAKLRDVGVVNPPTPPAQNQALMACYGILRTKLTQPCMLELIWSYWHEEAMLVQTMNAISWRFQNRRAGGRDPLAALEIDPLRPLNNLLWGFIQDEIFRLTLPRRAYEYDHHYGLSLIGRAVRPPVQGADSRHRFLEAFHHLLHLTSIFYKEDDDTTVIADGFPVLNALKEVHLLLTQGAHNQYGELPWQARQEMLMMEWMLARPEMREFLPTRIMVAYPEPWMDRVEAMKTLQGWSSTPVLHFRDLGVFGEQILLGIRFTAWTKVIDSDTAGNWARYWRPEIQGYIHAYRAATGVDLTERMEATPPAIHLQRRAMADGARR